MLSFMKKTRTAKLSLVILTCVAQAFSSCAKKKIEPAPPPPATLQEFEQSTAGKDPLAVAGFVLDKYNCNKCHALDEKGKLTLTSEAQPLGEGFRGCIPLLAEMNVVNLIPESDRTAEQRQKAAEFQQFGCAFCHRITPGKMGLTDIGDKLGSFHQGCNEGFCCLPKS
jgi:hypothetical protein